MYDMRLDSTNKGPDYFLTAYVTDYIVAKYMNYSETERDHLVSQYAMSNGYETEDLDSYKKELFLLL